jgi:hypothetical protein
MNQSPDRNPKALQEAIDKSTTEKPLSTRMEERGKNGPSLDSLIRDETAKRPD